MRERAPRFARVVPPLLLMALLGGCATGPRGAGRGPTLSRAGSAHELGQVAAVAAGATHACALYRDGVVRCWGASDAGQLGDGNLGALGARAAPVPVRNLMGVVAISAGERHTCAVLQEGAVRCWGEGGAGQLGDGLARTSAIPVLVTGVTTAVAVAAGREHTCALLRGGQVRCWGQGRAGQLGDGSRRLQPVPVAVAGVSRARALTAGAEHTCAVLAPPSGRVGGEVQCWGRNHSGQLGDGTTHDAATPAPVPGLLDVTGLSAGAFHTCAVTADHRLRCWGWDGAGQLGPATGAMDQDHRRPAPVAELSGVVAVAAGESHTCAVLLSGGLRCFGDGAYGQLGDGTRRGRARPAAVDLGAGFAVAVASGPAYTCAVLRGGEVRCFGDGEAGQLGVGAPPRSDTPVTVAGLQRSGGELSLAGGQFHTCSLRADGTVRCRGHNGSGQLGDGTTRSSATPVEVLGVRDAMAVVAGNLHSCALLRDGTVRCWGADAFGQLGDGGGARAAVPVAVPGLLGAVELAAGNTHTCALLRDGAVRCWGRNGNGQLGDGTTSDRREPVAATGVTEAVGLTAGALHTCALLRGGAVRCWGAGAFGQLGDGHSSDRPAAVSVTGVTEATGLTAGDFHTCALLRGGTVRCWGENFFGQLGDGSNLNRLVPVAVAGLTEVASVRAGYEHTCALRTSGAALCWGSNSAGQLGDGTDEERARPVPVQRLDGAVSLGLGKYHSCAVMGDGTARCWGWNGAGQIDDSGAGSVQTPVMVSDRVGLPPAGVGADAPWGTPGEDGAAASPDPDLAPAEGDSPTLACVMPAPAATCPSAVSCRVPTESDGAQLRVACLFMPPPAGGSCPAHSAT